MRTNLLHIKNLWSGILLAAILFVGCTGDEGPMGPMGPTGQKGDRGEPGPNAMSAQYTVIPGDWSGNQDRYRAILKLSEINKDIMENGAVLVYRIFDEAPASFNMLPYTAVDNSYITYLDFDVFLGEIYIYLQEINDGVNSTVAPNYNYAFKVVLIQGFSLDAINKNVDVRNYNDVVSYLNKNNIKFMLK
jgi:hypothetical protein